MADHDLEPEEIAEIKEEIADRVNKARLYRKGKCVLWVIESIWDGTEPPEYWAIATFGERRRAINCVELGIAKLVDRFGCLVTKKEDMLWMFSEKQVFVRGYESHGIRIRNIDFDQDNGYWYW